MPRRGHKRLVVDQSDPQGFGVRLVDFLDWMRVHNYSERTVESREIWLGGFVRWCGERGITRPTEVTKPILERYQRFLYYHRKKNGQALSFRSQYTRLVPVRTFFRWLARNNYLLYNPASDLDMPRLEKRLPKAVLTASEADAVLGQADVTEDLGVRDRAILETLYSTGMRRAELTKLAVYDLDVDRQTVMIRQGKGHKDRVVPIGERALAWIEKYRLDVRPGLVVPPDEGVLFLTNLGEEISPRHLSHLVRCYVDAAGLGKQGSCHLFRHTMATLMLENGADVRFIQEMLGHARLEATQIYTQVSIRKLKEIHTATHPSAKLGRFKGPSDDENALQDHSL